MTRGKGGRKLLTLQLQMIRIRQLFPQFTYRAGKKPAWYGTLQPTPESPEYQLKLEYRSGKSPKVWVLSPEVHPKAPHRYKDRSLCLYYPRHSEWHPGMLLAETIIPWAAEWLFFYEVWLEDPEAGGSGRRHPTVKRRRNPDKEVRILEELFLCHSSTDAQEIRVLAEELRLRGVVPWVDKNGGFQVGDENAGEAERAIDEDCFGLLFYATPEAFSSDFIRQVEVQRALRRKEDDPSFALFAVPRRMGFAELSRRSIEIFGVDLAAYSSRALKVTDGGIGEALREQLCVVADEVLDKVLALAGETDLCGALRMQFSTREFLADEEGDVLRLDAVELLEGATDPPRAWARVHGGLLSVKRRVSRHLGRPRLRVHGSKHLTAAFLLGFVFPSTVCEVDVRTKVGYWSTNHEPTGKDLMVSTVSDGTVGTGTLYVEISTGDKIVRDGVRRHVSRTGVSPLKYLRFMPGPKLGAVTHMTNADVRSIANQVRRELSCAVSDYGISEVHLFAAIPQHGFNAIPPVQLYEYEGGAYHPSFVLDRQA